MDIRKILSFAGAVLVIQFELGCSRAISAEIEIPEPKRNPIIGYITPEVPDVSYIPVTGNQYTELVPDTLDIAEMARLAIHGITEITNPEMDYEWYTRTLHYGQPPVMVQTGNTVNCQYKAMEALALLRYASGSNENLQVDQRWKEVALQLMGPDGIAYWPVEGRPWGEPGEGYTLPMLGDESRGQYCTPGFMGRLVSLMGIYAVKDDDPVWQTRSKQMVDRLHDLVIDKGDYASLPATSIAPGAVVEPDMAMATGTWASLNGWLIEGLAHHYLATGYEPSLKLANKLARYVMHHSGIFDDKGAYLVFDHFHHHSACILGIADLAAVTGNRELAEFAHGGYEYGKRMGDPIIGFFTEGQRFYNDDGTYTYKYHKGIESAETCEIADMIAIGMKLGELGYDHCWDDVDKWIRNHFVESQMKKSDWFGRLPGMSPEPMTTREVQANETSRDVPERNIGAFAGFSLPNDFIPEIAKSDSFRGQTFMHCCLGNGSRAVYYIWKNMLDFSKGRLRVNLLLNRASTWADIHSYIPYEGQVDVKVKKDLELEVRIPEWTQPGEVTCSINRVRMEISFNGRYAVVGDVKSGDKVSLMFPISERTVRTNLGGKPFTLVLKGNEVVFMDPPGKYYPLYQRDHYRENKVRWIQRERFAASTPFDW
jgi:hypothetical protein